MIIATEIVYDEPERQMLTVPAGEPGSRLRYVYIPLTDQECLTMGVKPSDPVKNFYPALRLTVLREE